MGSSEGYRAAFDGTRLFMRRSEPDGQIKGVVCIVHGVLEHSGRYGYFHEYLSGAGYVVSAFDLRGHGKSDGRRGDARFAATFRDLDQVLNDERTAAEARPIFLYGHSLGGLLVLSYLLDRRPAINGAVVSGPALHTEQRERRMRVALANLFGLVAPSLSVPARMDATRLSRDPAVVADYRADPLVGDRFPAGFARDALRAMDRVLRDAPHLPEPILVIHGGADRVNYLSGSQELVASAQGDVTLRVYDGVFHQPHTDPDKARIMEDVVSWLDAHRERDPSAVEHG